MAAGLGMGAAALVLAAVFALWQFSAGKCMSGAFRRPGTDMPHGRGWFSSTDLYSLYISTAAAT
jgi:hypothetical protein